MKEKQIKIGMRVRAIDNFYGCTNIRYGYIGEVIEIFKGKYIQGEYGVRLKTISTTERYYSDKYVVFKENFWKHFKEIKKEYNDKNNIFNTFNV